MQNACKYIYFCSYYVYSSDRQSIFLNIPEFWTLHADGNRFLGYWLFEWCARSLHQCWSYEGLDWFWIGRKCNRYVPLCKIMNLILVKMSSHSERELGFLGLPWFSFTDNQVIFLLIVSTSLPVNWILNKNRKGITTSRKNRKTKKKFEKKHRHEILYYKYISSCVFTRSFGLRLHSL